jgi:hypothetical protein
MAEQKTGRKMDSEWRKNISEGLKRAYAGISKNVDSAKASLKAGYATASVRGAAKLSSLSANLGSKLESITPMPVGGRLTTVAKRRDALSQMSRESGRNGQPRVVSERPSISGAMKANKTFAKESATAAMGVAIAATKKAKDRAIESTKANAIRARAFGASTVAAATALAAQITPKQSNGQWTSKVKVEAASSEAARENARNKQAAERNAKDAVVAARYQSLTPKAAEPSAIEKKVTSTLSRLVTKASSVKKSESAEAMRRRRNYTID